MPLYDLQKNKQDHEREDCPFSILLFLKACHMSHLVILVHQNLLQLRLQWDHCSGTAGGKGRPGGTRTRIEHMKTVGCLQR